MKQYLVDMIFFIRLLSGCLNLIDYGSVELEFIIRIDQGLEEHQIIRLDMREG